MTGEAVDMTYEAMRECPADKMKGADKRILAMM